MVALDRLRSWLSSRRGSRCCASLLLLLASALACAQNTTVSGTVYDPRTTSAALPLPNVLVYVTTATPAPLPSGVQCLTYKAPADAVSYTYTAVDGTFTLTGVPENTNYTLVIQSGKWRHQFSEPVAGTPLAGLQLHMPADHTQGDIPMIAIATGNVDGVECVLRDMGIADTEFTDDNGSVNAGGHIHLYKGSKDPGAQIDASTPSETTLMETPATLDNYDMVMFPCQGTATGQVTAAGATDLLDYANAGGRVFATHLSYAWLDPNSPFISQFPPTANWDLGRASLDGSNGYTATVKTDFSDGATLAQWLQNAGATNAGTSDQVQLYSVRSDISSVIAPSQSWVTLNSGSYSGQKGNPVIQMTFNTPVGSPASSQCGRVMFNDYHVINLASAGGKIFPHECPGATAMTAQEKMLEYALFDLSAFVQPVVVPTLSIAFDPSPLVVKQNDTGDQVVVNVTNTSATTEIGSSAVLTFTPPPLVTVTAMTDSTGGWICTVGKLTCTRNSSLGGGITDPVTLTLSVGAYPAGGLASYNGLLTATVSSVTFSSDFTASDTVIFQQLPPIAWATPAPIVYGTALGAAQLDASSPVAGVFTYTPPAGTVLPVGQHTLNVSFAPTDTTDYIAQTASVTLTVLPIVPHVTLAASANPVFLTSAITFTAAVPSPGTPPGGSVNFYDGLTQIGSAPIAGGSATITTSSLTAGMHSITAAYSGDSNYGAATSSPLLENVQDFTLTAAGGGTANVLPAGETAFTLAVTPVGGPFLPGAIGLAASGLPLGASAFFSPATITADSNAIEVTLQVKMAGYAANRPPSGPLGGHSLPVELGMVLLPLAALRRLRSRMRALLVLALAATAFAWGVTGCGGNLSPQSFTFPVTATSGALSHTVNVTLTVESGQH